MRTGIQPVEHFEIETISDPGDPRLTAFRDEIFVNDLKLPVGLRRSRSPHPWFVRALDEKLVEDAFKYSDGKWFNTGFDAVEAIIEDGRIVGMSGCRVYGDYLRSSMHLYLLKEVRRKYPGIKYLDGGWFDRHIEWANHHGLKGIFFTVFAYSNKLKALIRNHTQPAYSLVHRKHLKHMEEINYIGDFKFNGVPQSVFFYSINGEPFDPSGIFDE